VCATGNGGSLQAVDGQVTINRKKGPDRIEPRDREVEGSYCLIRKIGGDTMDLGGMERLWAGN